MCDVLNEVKSWLVAGTEFVVVEDWSCLDTNAVILKGTTVLTYKPRLLDRPFSGSLAGMEVSSLVATATAERNADLKCESSASRPSECTPVRVI